jgi:hypothetical protein
MRNCFSKRRNTWAARSRAPKSMDVTWYITRGATRLCGRKNPHNLPFCTSFGRVWWVNGLTVSKEWQVGITLEVAYVTKMFAVIPADCFALNHIVHSPSNMVRRQKIGLQRGQIHRYSIYGITSSTWVEDGGTEPAKYA